MIVSHYCTETTRLFCFWGIKSSLYVESSCLLNYFFFPAVFFLFLFLFLQQFIYSFTVSVCWNMFSHRKRDTFMKIIFPSPFSKIKWFYRTCCIVWLYVLVYNFQLCSIQKCVRNFTPKWQYDFYRIYTLVRSCLAQRPQACADAAYCRGKSYPVTLPSSLCCTSQALSGKLFIMFRILTCIK